jgi:hypothetical protein
VEESTAGYNDAGDDDDAKKSGGYETAGYNEESSSGYNDEPYFGKPTPNEASAPASPPVNDNTSESTYNKPKPVRGSDLWNFVWP